MEILGGGNLEKILCATRGGEASYKTQDAAIALASERGAEIVFLFVVDARFLKRTERPLRRETILKEMAHMGEFLLLMAVERAKKQGVKASIMVRHGGVRGGLIDAARDPAISTLVLGKPAGQASFFSLADLEAFAREVEKLAKTEVVLAEISISGEEQS